MIGVLQRNGQPAKCQTCGSGWGYTEWDKPLVDPFKLSAAHQSEGSKQQPEIACGNCGRRLS